MLQVNQLYNKPILKIAGVLALAFVVLVLSFVIVKLGEKSGVLVIVGLLGAATVLYSFINISFGFYASIIVGFLIFILQRLLGPDLPWGTIIEVQTVATFSGAVVGKIAHRKPLFEGAAHPITYGYLIYTLFLFIELFNPYMHSIEGWAFIFRKFLQFLMIYFIALEVFKDMKRIKFFFGFWIGCAVVAGMYGCYQEWFGMFDFEMNWIFSVPGRANLYSLDNGNFRKFSLLSDPAAYGILMASSSLCVLVLALGTKSLKNRMLLLTGCIFLMLGMAYSGTRTAYSLIPAGVALYILMTITRKSTLIFACLFLMGFIVIIWGPIYGNPTINRIRSTFEFSEDASLQVRDVNRKSIQPYIYRHPIGGGLATSGMQGLQYNPVHFLAGFPPDSGYVRSAVETGWIGFALQCMLYFVILQSGVHGFYNSSSKIVRLYFLTVLVTIFSFVIAQYAQVSIGQIPGCFLFYPFLAIMVQLQRMNKIQSRNELEI